MELPDKGKTKGLITSLLLLTITDKNNNNFWTFLCYNYVRKFLKPIKNPNMEYLFIFLNQESFQNEV